MKVYSDLYTNQDKPGVIESFVILVMNVILAPLGFSRTISTKVLLTKERKLYGKTVFAVAIAMLFLYMLVLIIAKQSISGNARHILCLIFNALGCGAFCMWVHAMPDISDVISSDVVAEDEVVTKTIATSEVKSEAQAELDVDIDLDIDRDSEPKSTFRPAILDEGDYSDAEFSVANEEESSKEASAEVPEPVMVKNSGSSPENRPISLATLLQRESVLGTVGESVLSSYNPDTSFNSSLHDFEEYDDDDDEIYYDDQNRF